MKMDSRSADANERKKKKKKKFIIIHYNTKYKYKMELQYTYSPLKGSMERDTRGILVSLAIFNYGWKSSAPKQFAEHSGRMWSSVFRCRVGLKNPLSPIKYKTFQDRPKD